MAKIQYILLKQCRDIFHDGTYFTNNFWLLEALLLKIIKLT